MVDILSRSIKMKLPFKLETVHFFVSKQTYTFLRVTDVAQLVNTNSRHLSFPPLAAAGLLLSASVIDSIPHIYLGLLIDCI